MKLVSISFIDSPEKCLPLKHSYRWEAISNAAGFSAVPSGARTRRDIFMPFWGGGRYADFWTATAGNDNDAWIRSLVWSPWHPGTNQIFRDKLSKEYGYSIRCVQD